MPPQPSLLSPRPLATYLVACTALALCTIASSSADTMGSGEVAQRDTNRPFYEVKFPTLGDHAPAGADSAELIPGVTSMRVVTARGQAMRCLLPAPAATATPSYAPVSDENRFDDIDDLLSQYSNGCFLRREGWWTYEFCYGKHVVQKHVISRDRDPFPGEVEDKFVLGRLDHDLDLTRRKNASEVSTKDSAFTQMFTNGTVCDTTNEPRRVLVKYFCWHDALKLGDPSKDGVVRDVREVRSCVYELEFFNAAICHHATYKEKLARTARQIHCSMEENQGPFEGLKSRSYKKASLSL